MNTPDINYKSYADQSGVRVSYGTFAPENPGLYDDILKVSHCDNAVFADCIVNPDGGNREDGVDVMRDSYDVSFNRCRVGAGDKYAFTIKGGSNMIFLTDVVITRPGGGWERVDIDLGNYSSTTPNSKTGRVVLTNLRREDGKPVRVRVGWADRPYISEGNVKVLFWQSIFLKIYVAVRRLIG